MGADEGTSGSARCRPATMLFDPLTLAAELPDEMHFEQAILDLLQSIVGFDAAFFAVVGETPTTVGLDPAKLYHALTARAYDHELRPLKQAAIAARGVAIDTEVFGETGVQRLACHRDFAAPIGGRHGLMAFLQLRGRPFGALMLGRTGSSFSGNDVRRIEELLPRIAMGRASFNVPWISAPLMRETAPPSLATWALGWARGEHVLARQGAVVIREKNGFREMVVRTPGAEMIWSRARPDDPRQSGWFYLDLFHLAASRARRRRRALFLGCGGGVGARQFAEVYPGLRIDLVEIDPRVVEAAREWYDLGAIPRLTVHIADGAEFLKCAPSSQWDIVVVDVFDAAELPASCATPEFFRDVHRVLRPGGSAAFNTIGSLDGASPVQHVERLARAALTDVRLVPVLDPGEVYSASATRNVVLLGSRRD